MQQPTTVSANRQPATTAPHVVTPHRPSINQSTLAEILKRRRELKEAEKAVKALKNDLGLRECGVIKAIAGGATVAHGILTAEVRHEERRNVAWRKVAEEYLGADFCQIVIEETEPTPHIRLTIA